MSQTLIPILGIGFIVLFVFALWFEAKRQKSGKKNLFEQYAAFRGWEFLPEDNGTIQTLTKEFQGLNVFKHPSLGLILPENVILGNTNNGPVYFYLHSLHLHEGNFREWYVCMQKAQSYICDSLIIEFKKPPEFGVSQVYYSDPRFSLGNQLDQSFTIHGVNHDQLRKLLSESLLTLLEGRAKELPWAVDIQIRGDLVAVYISDRNQDLAAKKDFEALENFTSYVLTLFKQ